MGNKELKGRAFLVWPKLFSESEVELIELGYLLAPYTCMWLMGNESQETMKNDTRCFSPSI